MEKLDLSVQGAEAVAAKAGKSLETPLSVEEAIRQSTPKRRALKLRKSVGRAPRAPLSVEQILAWADAWNSRTGAWPTITAGTIPEAPGETWAKIDAALRKGQRGLSETSSLYRLLVAHCRVTAPAPHSIEQILAWADAWRATNGKWPNELSGPIYEGAEETWGRVNTALYGGYRGLPGGSSLALLLGEGRGARNRTNVPDLTVAQIMDWAQSHRARTGRWPTGTSEPPPEAPDETWCAIDNALRAGVRGLPGGSSLARLLDKPKQVRSERSSVRISEVEILEWADAHYQAKGSWPTRYSGPVAAMPGEVWSRINASLYEGSRGLPGGSSLAQLLQHRRGVRNDKRLPALTEEGTLRCADAWYQRFGTWPTENSGRYRTSRA